MGKLRLSVAVGDYDRTRPLIDGSVQIDGIDPVFMTLSPEEIFFRAMRHAEFDICELSLSSFVLRTARGDNPYVGVPAFVSRAFRHTSMYVRRDRVQSPIDLKGCKVGVPEYQLTAIVWARAILQEDYGVKPSDIIWVRGGIEEPGRPEKLSIDLPPEVRVLDAPAQETISSLLDSGEIDGYIAPRPPTCMGTNPNIGWLFPDPIAAAEDYFRRTKIFPIMHLMGVRRDLAEEHPWICAAVLKAFDRAKSVALSRLADSSAPKSTLPFLEERLAATRQLMGYDFWPYGLSQNEHCLEAFLSHHHVQGLSSRLLTASSLFSPATTERFKI